MRAASCQGGPVASFGQAPTVFNLPLSSRNTISWPGTKTIVAWFVAEMGKSSTTADAGVPGIPTSTS
jgi:hypothetical protein